MDPSVVRVQARPVSPSSVGAFDAARFGRKALVVRDTLGHEKAIFADEVGQVQLEVASGTLADGPVHLEFEVSGLTDIPAKVRTLSRLSAWHRLGRFPRSLFPPDTNAAKWVRALQAYDGMRAGASQREIAIALLGEKEVRDEWNGRSDFLRARVQRLLSFARSMVDGGYRKLLH